MLNYLKETLSFLDAVPKDPISPRAQVLWHYLLYFNNQAAIALDNGDYYWPVWFTVDNGVLVKVMGLKDSRSLYQYRKMLINRDFIQFRLRKTSRAPLDSQKAANFAANVSTGEYALTPFTPGFEKRALDEVGGEGKSLVWVEDVTRDERGEQVSTIYNKYYINNINKQVSTIYNKYYINNINKKASITAPPTAIAPSTRPNPFDAIAERGRQAALRRVTDEDMEEYLAD